MLSASCDDDDDAPPPPLCRRSRRSLHRLHCYFSDNDVGRRGGRANYELHDTDGGGHIDEDRTHSRKHRIYVRRYIVVLIHTVGCASFFRLDEGRE